MPALIAVLVNNSTMAVENIGQVGTPTPVINGKQFLFSSQWAAGVAPTIGMIWNGDAPATFAPAPIVEPEILPTNEGDAIEQIEAQLQAAFDAVAQLKALRG